MITMTNTLDYDQAFIQFYQAHPQLHTLDKQARLTLTASYFLNQPYHFEPLGEGIHGKYSKLPLYRADQFDCVTYVDTVLALLNADDFSQFKQAFLKIRYTGQVDYTHRTDWFTDFEWNPHLQKLGYIEDVTDSIHDKDNHPMAKLAITTINKRDYYANKIMANLDVTNLSEDAAIGRLKELRAEGQKFTAQPSEIPYIPLTDLFDAQGQPNTVLWDQFPSISIIEIVRPNWRPVNPKDKQTDYGTHLNVSHLGIAIRTENDIFFYHAAINNAVIKLRLADYLHPLLNDTRTSPVRGIHIEKIL